MKASELFSREEIRELTQRSDLRGLLSVAVDWAWIAAALAVVAAWPHPLLVLGSLFVIGGRQLGLAVLTHECAHRSLFRTPWLGDLVGTWVCGAPVWTDLRRYREHHRAHHNHTGTDADPDLGLVTPFPTTRSSLLRKVARDLSGVAALRRVAGLLAMDAGSITYTASTESQRLPTPSPAQAARSLLRHTGPVLLTNAALLGLLALLGRPELYLLWLAAWCTTYSLVLRLRSMAEHACTERIPDLLRNTRTTAAHWGARLLLAPHHVNYHLEHHLLPTVPHWRLPEVHARLQERGLLGPHNQAPGYLAVLKHVTQSP
jgi:fatty acid desaturase